MTPQLTGVFEGRREAKESALAPVGVICTTGTTIVFVTCGTSVIESLLGARFDYRLTPQLVVGAGATYLVDEFKGAARTDHTISPLASIKYFATPSLILALDYRRVNFDSTGLVVPGYVRNVFLASVNGRF